MYAQGSCIVSSVILFLLRGLEDDRNPCKENLASNMLNEV
jgi:hypothetical protein